MRTNVLSPAGVAAATGTPTSVKIPPRVFVPSTPLRYRAGSSVAAVVDASKPTRGASVGNATRRQSTPAPASATPRVPDAPMMSSRGLEVGNPATFQTVSQDQQLRSRVLAPPQPQWMPSQVATAAAPTIQRHVSASVLPARQAVSMLVAPAASTSRTISPNRMVSRAAPLAHESLTRSTTPTLARRVRTTSPAVRLGSSSLLPVASQQRLMSNQPLQSRAIAKTPRGGGSALLGVPLCNTASASSLQGTSTASTSSTALPHVKSCSALTSHEGGKAGSLIVPPPVSILTIASLARSSSVQQVRSERQLQPPLPLVPQPHQQIVTPKPVLSQQAANSEAETSGGDSFSSQGAEAEFGKAPSEDEELDDLSSLREALAEAAVALERTEENNAMLLERELSARESELAALEASQMQLCELRESAGRLEEVEAVARLRGMRCQELEHEAGEYRRALETSALTPRTAQAGGCKDVDLVERTARRISELQDELQHLVKGIVSNGSGSERVRGDARHYGGCNGNLVVGRPGLPNGFDRPGAASLTLPMPRSVSGDLLNRSRQSCVTCPEGNLMASIRSLETLLLPDKEADEPNTQPQSPDVDRNGSTNNVFSYHPATMYSGSGSAIMTATGSVGMHGHSATAQLAAPASGSPLRPAPLFAGTAAGDQAAAMRAQVVRRRPASVAAPVAVPQATSPPAPAFPNHHPGDGSPVPVVEYLTMVPGVQQRLLPTASPPYAGGSAVVAAGQAHRPEVAIALTHPPHVNRQVSMRLAADGIQRVVSPRGVPPNMNMLQPHQLPIVYRHNALESPTAAEAGSVPVTSPVTPRAVDGDWRQQCSTPRPRQLCFTNSVPTSSTPERVQMHQASPRSWVDLSTSH
eukprot:TRINITY_DN12519_c0_g1_i1.p1 TRINITY_DN12519_c0_g1~~TRINITY_DN12519_c0_g1_i1.p1  ORF type:complete len:869 (-),score=137.47 TRINITY_DN12519_c0_g1_i1:177-2783(-)